MVGGTPLPVANMLAWSARACVATLPDASVLAKLNPQTLSATLKRPYAFEYVTAIALVAKR